MTNIIVLPKYYSGTAFEEIVEHMVVAVKHMSIPIHFIGPTKPIKNNLPGLLLDDERYTRFQLKLISHLINLKEPTKILFLDFFNPGLDILRYHHEQKGIHAKYGALLHGGTFFDDDIYSMPWLRGFESAWAEIYDVVYVASNYAKRKLPSRIYNKAKVLPWGLDSFKKINHFKNKKYDVIFPHRLSPDKGVEDLIKIVKFLPMIKFTITSPQEYQTIKSNLYYKELKKSNNVNFILGQNQIQHAHTLSQSNIVLSCAKQETFGYSVMKSVLYGCIPVLPKNQCYPEFFRKEYLYQTMPEAVNMIKKYTSIKQGVRPIALKIKNSEKLSFKNHLDDFFGKK